jgi:hypothetical protein
VHFDPTSHENKLIYTSIFTEYTTRVETLMSDALEASALGVSLEDVELLVEAQPERLQVSSRAPHIVLNDIMGCFIDTCVFVCCCRVTYLTS